LVDEVWADVLDCTLEVLGCHSISGLWHQEAGHILKAVPQAFPAQNCA